jgi:PIN domain nuclease of toxin-antitoxin system
MSTVIVDTHILIWYITKPNYLSNDARSAINQAIEDGFPLFISSISIVEICYLTEKGKISPIVLERMESAMHSLDSGIEVIALDHEIALAVRQIDRRVVPELPDRIIAATALHLNLPLVTKDRKIRSLTTIQTIWGSDHPTSI